MRCSWPQIRALILMLVLGAAGWLVSAHETAHASPVTARIWIDCATLTGITAGGLIGILWAWTEYRGPRDEMGLQLIGTVGLPGSGKSTWASSWARRDTTRRAEVNRDCLRRMMHGGWANAEDQITAAENAVITALLARGISVVCSDTNLSQDTINGLAALAAAAGASFSVRDFRNVPLAVCIERDARRTGPDRVGAEQITRMYGRFIAPGHDQAASPAPL